MPNVRFSLILPTRGRPERLTRFLDSLAATTDRPEAVEVVLVVDADDASMAGYAHDGLPLRRVEMAPGQAMGRLNQAGYLASRGEYIFLVNDDLVAGTPGWDTRMDAEFRRFPDGIALLHVNELLFRERLCTFPCVTRLFCEKVGGICPEGYHRHRIDDHIYNIFNMIAYLGETRTIYLPDVIFEHEHYVLTPDGRREYAMHGDIHGPDIALFEASLDSRKRQAVELTAHIRAWREREKTDQLRARLEPLQDAFCIRTPDYIEIHHRDTPPTSADTRVTIGVVSADSRREVPTRCLEAIKRHTANYELVLFDNNFSPRFNHAADMNRIMDACATRHLVLMDDDVLVAPGWLDALLGGLTGDTGVVGPVLTDAEGDVSYAGILFRPDRSGNHGHLFTPPAAPAPIMTMSSAVFLVDRARCGQLRFDETMPKYFLDLDYGLRVWESGAKLTLAPGVPVCHIGGATLAYGQEENLRQWEEQRRVFAAKWFETGRIDALAETAFAAEPALRRQWALLGRIDPLLAMEPGETREAYRRRARAVYEELAPIPALNQYLIDRVWNAVKARGGIGNGLEDGRWPLAYLSSLYGRQVFTGEHGDYNTFYFEEAFWAVPKAYAPRFIRSLRRMNRPGLLTAPSHEALLAAVDAAGPHRPMTPGQGTVAETHPQGFIVAFDNRFMACPGQVPDSLHDGLTPVVPGGVFFSLEAARSCLFSERPEPIEPFKGQAIYKFHHMYYAAPGLDEADFAQGTPRVRQALRAYTLSEIHHDIAFAARQASGAAAKPPRLALFCTLPPPAMAPFRAAAGEGALLVHLPADRQAYAGADTLEVACREGTHPDFDVNRVTEAWRREFAARGLDAVLLPARHPDTWEHNLAERLAAQVCGHVILLDERGNRRSFSGECARRLEYNKANLCALFRHVRPEAVASALEVGCSDGLACELVAMLGVPRVRGIDTSAVVNLVPTSPAVKLARASCERLPFDDASFDLVFSIAVMEHVPQPDKAFEEMLRVTRPGGYCYVQTAPLYFSPFGHHMPYFREPWAHLTHTPDELIEYAGRTGLAATIEAELHIGAGHYIKGMLCPDHINGLTALEFGFDAVVERHGLEVLCSQRSHEGRDLLPEKRRARLWPYTFGELTDHGIQLLVRKP